MLLMFIRSIRADDVSGFLGRGVGCRSCIDGPHSSHHTRASFSSGQSGHRLGHFLETANLSSCLRSSYRVVDGGDQLPV
jgi:hypothetical protein